MKTLSFFFSSSSFFYSFSSPSLSLFSPFFFSFSFSSLSRPPSLTLCLLQLLLLLPLSTFSKSPSLLSLSALSSRMLSSVAVTIHASSPPFGPPASASGTPLVPFSSSCSLSSNSRSPLPHFPPPNSSLSLLSPASLSPSHLPPLFSHRSPPSP